MRIALVAEVMETGVGQLVALLARELAERGHEVHLLHSVRRSDAAALWRLRQTANIRCIAIDMRRELHLSDLAAIRSVRLYLKRHGPFDIVHGHSSKGGALARLAGAGLPGVRLYTPHAFYTLSPALGRARHFLYAGAERALAKLCRAIICSSALERDHAIALGIAAERLSIIHNAIDAPVLAPSARQQFGFPDSAVIVGFVGRLADQKAPRLLIEAFAHATRQHSDIALVMVGDGPLESVLQERAASLGIAARMRWVGHRPSKHYLTSFDILAMPSRYEGFSLMPLEAMHAALPIVCTNVGGVTEAVLDGVTGLVVPVDDCAALSAAIVALARDPAQRVALGRAAHARASLFSGERMVATMEQYYRDVLADRRPAKAELSMHAQRRGTATQELTP